MRRQYTLKKVPGVVIEGHQDGPRSGTVLMARSKGAKGCAHCGKKQIRKRGQKKRQVRHTDFDGRPCYLLIRGHKYECLSCGRYFCERYEGIQPRRKHTEAFRKETVNSHTMGINQLDLQRTKKVGSSSVELWYKDFLTDQVSEWDRDDCPKYIGIDEHTFSKKQRFATTIVDLSRNRVMDVLPDTQRSTIAAYFKGLTGRDKVEMICMDMSGPFRSVMKELFPNARIVADRFHVIQLVTHHFLKTVHQIDPTAKYNRGILNIMRKHHKNLTEIQQQKLANYFQNHPEIQPIYFFKQDIANLMLNKQKTRAQCVPLAKQLLFTIDQLKLSGFPSLVALAKTLTSWSQEIACMWRFSKSNSITEGFHRKMKLIQRRAYGFKNFDNYRLRVLALCGHHDFILT